MTVPALSALVIQATQAPVLAGPRIIAGPILPWNVSARPNGYPGPVRFAPHSIDLASLAAAPLVLDHDLTKPVGKPTGIIDRPDTLQAAFKVSKVPRGDEALTLVADGVRDGFSVRAAVDDYQLIETEAGELELYIVAARIVEVSLLTVPAYTLARATIPT